jgi:hypothetical protein
MSTNDLPHSDEPAEMSGADLIRVLRDPQTFEHLVDRSPACQKDLRQAWGYMRRIHPRPPRTVPADECDEMSTTNQPHTDDPDALEVAQQLVNPPSVRGRRGQDTPQWGA